MPLFKVLGSSKKSTPQKRGRPSTSSSSSSDSPNQSVSKQSAKTVKFSSNIEDLAQLKIEMVLTDEDLKKIEGVLDKLLNTKLQTVIQSQQDVAKKIVRIESSSRAKNILITGMPEGDDSPAGSVQQVFALCDEIGVPHPIVDDAFRMGKKGAEPRRMLLKLVSMVDKKRIMAHAKALRKKKVYLNDDLSAEERKKNGQLRAHFKTLKASRPGINFSIRNCIMMIWENNKIIERYHVEDDTIKVKTSGVI